jgi:hypothetical protein
MTRAILAGILAIMVITSLTPITLSQSGEFELYVSSPTGSVYTAPTVPLNWSANREVGWAGYALDGGPFTTLTGNSTISNLNNGTHVLTLAANDTSGSAATLEITFDVIDMSAPTFDHNQLYQAYAGFGFTIGADIFDDFTVEEAGVYYRYASNESYTRYPMSFCNTCGGIYKAIIPASLSRLGTFYYYLNATDGVNFAFSPSSGYETNPYAISIVPKPVKPSPVALSNATGVSGTMLQLTWSQSGDANFTSYRVFQSTQKGITGNDLVTITDRSVTSYTVAGLSLNTTYYFIVRTYNNQSQYADSNQISVTTAQPSPLDAFGIALIIIAIAAIAGAAFLYQKRRHPKSAAIPRPATKR